MSEMTTYRLTVHLDNGQSIVTEDATLSSDEGEAQAEVVEEIENRENPWKFLGHLVVNFRNIVAVEVEALG